MNLLEYSEMSDSGGTYRRLTGVHLLQHPANRDVQLGSRMSIAPLSEWGYFRGKVKLGSDLSLPANVKWIPKPCMTGSIHLCQ